MANPEPSPEAPDVVVWLIERGQPEGFDPPVWWSLTRTLPESYTWTSDAANATRFTTRGACEAEIQRRSHPLASDAGSRHRPFGRATAHVFVGPDLLHRYGGNPAPVAGEPEPRRCAKLVRCGLAFDHFGQCESPNALRATPSAPPAPPVRVGMGLATEALDDIVSYAQSIRGLGEHEGAAARGLAQAIIRRSPNVRAALQPSATVSGQRERLDLERIKRELAWPTRPYSSSHRGEDYMTWEGRHDWFKRTVPLLIAEVERLRALQGGERIEGWAVRHTDGSTSFHSSDELGRGHPYKRASVIIYPAPEGETK